MLNWLELPEEERAQNFDEWCRFFFTLEGTPFKNFADKKLLEKHPDLDMRLRREAERLDRAKERIEAARMAERTAAVLRLGVASAAKNSNGVNGRRRLLDYDDLVIRTARLLRRPGIAPWILYKLDGGLDHMLVDEAQDTSRAQWSIVAALAEEVFCRGRSADGCGTYAVCRRRRKTVDLQFSACRSRRLCRNAPLFLPQARQ